MNKNVKNKSVTSIAIKLNSIFVRNMFFKFILLDIILIAVLTGMWCMDSEMNFFGEVAANAQRHFDFYPLETAAYTVSLDNGNVMVKDAGNFIYNVKKILMIIAAAEGIFIFGQAASGTQKIRRYLKPLDEIAETANRLSRMPFDDEKFHSLEDAISKISPEAADERIYVEDSELRGLEDAINNLLDRMRESYRQQARFVSDASHELRTPIAVIQGYANMLDRWGKNDESVLDESIEAIKTESENMKNLVEQLLFLARGINGKTQLMKDKFLLNNMVHEVAEESQMIDDRHEYRCIADTDIAVYGDRRLLKQTARILAENAAKYTEAGGEIKLFTGVNENGEPYFSVQDDGIGIDGKDVPHIFDRFFRADTSRERKTGGTGLGLSIAKWIIDGHKGYFGVLSRSGIGTRITVFLPKELDNNEEKQAKI